MKPRKAMPPRTVPMKRTGFKPKVPTELGAGQARAKPEAGSLGASPVKARWNTGPRKPVKDLVIARAAGDTADGSPLCEVCGVKLGANIHHRQPRLMGGTREPHINRPSNLLLVCGHGNAMPGCHHDIESRRTYAKSVFWLVPRPLKPVEMPVLRRGRYVWLTDAGEAIPCDLAEIAAWIGAVA
jgi:5-methylcytosine-specific restriction enzyme A